jgi:hypothetical protein
MPTTTTGIIVTASDTFDLSFRAVRGRAEKLEAKRYKARHTARRHAADTRRQFSYPRAIDTPVETAEK